MNEDTKPIQLEVDMAEAAALTYIVEISEIPGVWTAHCLEVDVVGQSRVDGSPESALENTIGMVAATIALWRKDGTDPFKDPAPGEYWPPELLKRRDVKTCDPYRNVGVHMTIDSLAKHDREQQAQGIERLCDAIEVDDQERASTEKMREFAEKLRKG